MSRPLRVVRALFLVALAIDTASSLATPKPPLEIEIVSSRADMVSGGDALVDVRAPAGTPLTDLRLTLNGRDVTNVLSGRSGRFRGLVAGMREGDNLLRASCRGLEDAAVLSVRNHPIVGPMFSGPHLTPYECRTEESGLGSPLDSDCSAARRVEFFYRTTDGEFKPLPEPTERPADLVTTTTSAGVTVPYVVRIESGTLNRSIYRIAMLDDPEAWNRRLAIAFFGGNGTQYNQGVLEAEQVLNDAYLSRGFALASASELVNGLHDNPVLQAETLMMLKERFIEQHGPPSWTVGDGVSGGASAQLCVTNAYPGLLDGLQPAMAFPDTTMYRVWDCVLFQAFWRGADPGVWTEAKRAAVEGYARGLCSHQQEWNLGGVFRATRAVGCGLADSGRVYDPVKNPRGARCTSQDLRVNIYGRDPRTGYARRPQDNVGVQYGLAGLNHGAISVDEFLELNERIGGLDIDGVPTPDRTEGDRLAIRAAYESGLINSFGGGLATVPIIDWRAYSDASGDVHDRELDLVIRTRLQKANGRFDNQVIWVGPPDEEDRPSPVDLEALSLETISCWLDNLAADGASLSIEKVVRNRPAKATDTWWDEGGGPHAEPVTWDPDSPLNRTYPLHQDPRTAAGSPLALDVLKCQTKPVDYADYAVSFTDAQKAHMARIFPTGVCDFTRPGVEQVPMPGPDWRYGP